MGPRLKGGNLEVQLIWICESSPLDLGDLELDGFDLDDLELEDLELEDLKLDGLGWGGKYLEKT